MPGKFLGAKEINSDSNTWPGRQQIISWEPETYNFYNVLCLPGGRCPQNRYSRVELSSTAPTFTFRAPTKRVIETDTWNVEAVRHLIVEKEIVIRQAEVPGCTPFYETQEKTWLKWDSNPRPLGYMSSPTWVRFFLVSRERACNLALELP